MRFRDYRDAHFDRRNQRSLGEGKSLTPELDLDTAKGAKLRQHLVEKDVADLKRKWAGELPNPGTAVLIAASNSPDVYRSQAMFLCDGDADQIEINKAIALAQRASDFIGGDVVLAPGLYVISDTVTLDRGRLTGLGHALDSSGASIVVADSTFGNKAMVHLSNSEGGLLNLGVFGYDSNWNVVNLKCMVHIADGGNSSVDRCFIDGGDPAGGFANDGILIDSAGSHRVTDCVVSSCGGHGIYAGTFGAVLARGNRIQRNSLNGIRSMTGNGTTTSHIVDNDFLNNGELGASTSESAQLYVQGHDLVEANTFSGDSSTGPGVYVDGVRAVVVGNSFGGEGGDGYIIVSSSGDESIVVGNNLTSQTTDGVVLDGAERCLVQGNSIIGRAGNCGIRLAAASYNTIIGNKVYGQDSPTDMEAGIKVADAGCVSNVVCGNDLSQGVYATAPIINAGTTTKLTYPAHATYGDNFT